VHVEERLHHRREPHQQRAGVQLTLAQRWNGTKWSVQRTRTPVFSAGSSELAGVSCASPAGGQRLRYEADEALKNVAYLHIAAGRLTRFAHAAGEIGSDHWMPIATEEAVPTSTFGVGASDRRRPESGLQ
jgi:hypothetical protein